LKKRIAGYMRKKEKKISKKVLSIEKFKVQKGLKYRKV